jgi:hypothetical protein
MHAKKSEVEKAVLFKVKKQHEANGNGFLLLLARPITIFGSHRNRK